MGLRLFMSQVNWTQLTKAVVLIRSLAFSGSSWAPEVGHPLPRLAIPQGSASQGEKVPLFPMQHLHGPCGILSCCTSLQLCSGHKMWKVQTCPFGLTNTDTGTCVMSALDLPP